MTKQQIVRMHNNLADSLIEIKHAIIAVMKNNGATWTSDAGDTEGSIFLTYRDQDFKFTNTQWFIDGEEVPFFKFLATIMQE